MPGCTAQTVMPDLSQAPDMRAIEKQLSELAVELSKAGVLVFFFASPIKGKEHLVKANVLSIGPAGLMRLTKGLDQYMTEAQARAPKPSQN